MKRKFFKILLSVVILIVLVLSVTYVCGGLFTSVDFDAGVCGGGFDRHLIDTEGDEIKKSIGCEISEEELNQIMSRFEFDGRKIYTSFVDENGDTVNIEGKKIWYDEYVWKKV